MTEPDPTVTQQIRRYAPIRARILEWLTPKAAVFLACGVIGTSSTALYQFHALRQDVTDLKAAIVTAQTQGERIAALEEALKGVKERQAEDHARWTHADEQFEKEPPVRRRR